MNYRCNVCNVFEFETERGNSLTKITPGTEPEDFPDDWECPICHADKTHLKPIIKKEGKIVEQETTFTCPHCGRQTQLTISHVEEVDLEAYLGEWRRETDEIEEYMSDIHRISNTGESIIEPMRTTKTVSPNWDDILIKGAQLARIPLDKDAEVNTQTIIGPNATQPLIIDTPIYVTHMSFGALSREVKRHWQLEVCCENCNVLRRRRDSTRIP